MEPFLAQIMLFAGTFTPKGWLPCDGRELPIGGNEALFSLIGTMYGGDGQRTFALPDLRGRAPVGAGEGSGVPALGLGDAGGAPSAAAGAGSEYNAGPYLSLGFYIAVAGIFPSRE